jgi:hypothetical protein
MFFRKKTTAGRSYLQIVENRWEDGRPRQHVLLTLGRMETLQETGALDTLLQSGARFSSKLLVLSAHRRGQVPTVAIRDLEALTEVEAEQDGHRFLLRSEARGSCGKVFLAVGVALPPTVRRVDAQSSA